jgi:hypothetical protein
MRDFIVDFKTYSPDEFEMQQDPGIPNFRISPSVVAYHKPTESYVRSHYGRSQLENRYYAMTALIFMLDLQRSSNDNA